MEKLIDLHIHTTASDGSYTPEETVMLAKKVGISAIAIADHDSTNGIESALIAGQKHGIEIIPAIELSSESHEQKSPELHFLGFWINRNNEKLQQHLSSFRNSRKKRAFKMLEKLAKINVHLETEELMKIADTGSIGRLHFAKALLAQKFIHNIHEAFDKYLAPGRPAFVKKQVLTSRDAINLINQAGGISVLAHPLYGVDNNKDLLKILKEAGLDGIEVYHPRHSNKVISMFEQQADELGLIKTGGSDCHGGINGNPPSMGNIKIPYAVLENLKKYKKHTS